MLAPRCAGRQWVRWAPHELLAGAQHAGERGTIAITLASLGEIDDAVIGAFRDELSSTDASARERIVRSCWLLGDADPQLLAPSTPP